MNPGVRGQLDLEKDGEDMRTSEQSQQSSNETATSPPLEKHTDSERQPEPIEDIVPEGLIGRVLSKTMSRISVDPGPPPDGGFLAWSQAFLGHLVVFNVWGYINTFGVFQQYYVRALNRPPSAISWIGSIQIFLLFFIGTFSGRATDAGLFRPAYFSGACFFILGVFMTSLCTQYWQVFLAQGVCVGVGMGLLFCPTVTLVSTYFSKHRAIGIAITASGTATGGIVFPVIVQQLLPKIGFGWTVRILGFVMIVTFGIPFIFLKTRLPPRKAGPIVEWNAFRELSYLFYCIGMFLVFWGLFFAFYYLPSFGRDIIGISYKESIDNLLILNGIGLFGRLIPNYVADKFFKPITMIIAMTAVTAIMIFCWPAVHSAGGLKAFAVVYGFSGAAIQSLFPATATFLTKDVKKTGVRLGMIFSVVSLASLTGPPISGALIQQANGRYLYAEIFAGVVMLAGSLTTLACAIALKVEYRRKQVNAA